MKAIVTGSSGFIGTNLIVELESNGYEVVKCDLKSSKDTFFLDILDGNGIRRALEEHSPDVIFNLAGQANVGLSWEKPQITVQLNTVGLINILESVRAVNPSIRVVAIGSSDEYGILNEKGVDVKEDIPVKPVTPYAISKYAQELFSQLYVCSYGMDICMIRLFNLGGPGQARGYMISDFASGIAEIELGNKEFLSVGNLDSARDYTHVFDACRAIRLVSEKGHAGEVYNICSGTAHKAKEVLDTLIEMAKVRIDVRHDPKKMRPSDTPVVCGNHSKLTMHTGWIPRIRFEQILSDTLVYWRNQIRNN